MVPPPPLRKYVPALPTAVEEVVLKALAKDQNLETILAAISAVEEVVLKALAKEPRDRFVNVQAFAQALAQAQ